MSNFNPQYLKKGDTVGLVSPSRHISMNEVKPTISWLKKNGLKVELGPNMFNQKNQMAGSDSDKISDIQAFINSPNISLPRVPEFLAFRVKLFLYLKPLIPFPIISQ